MSLLIMIMVLSTRAVHGLYRGHQDLKQYEQLPRFDRSFYKR